MDEKILLVGTVSNVAKTIEKELAIVLKALSMFDSVEVFLVESDSTDDTVKILESIRNKNLRLNYIALGPLRHTIPNRIERLRYCRNQYVKYIRSNYFGKAWEYIAVADLDGMNFKLSEKAIKSCFESKIYWDGVMANQKNGYYDLLALRASNWLEGDYSIILKKVKENSVPPLPSKYKFITFIKMFNFYDAFRKNVIYDNMRIIPSDKEWIKVFSAFGGFALYKSYLFLQHNYDKTNGNREEKIDHVDFNLKNSADGAIFFINPRLINNNWNVYNINRLKVVRIIREFKKSFK